jgi:hypothetical protein
MGMRNASARHEIAHKPRAQVNGASPGLIRLACFTSRQLLSTRLSWV